LAALTRLFDERYANLYGPGAAVPDAGYRVSLYKVIGTGAIGVRDLAPDLVSTEADPRPRAHRRALVDANSAEFADVPVYSGELLPAGFGADGPAILEFVDTNVLVPSGFGFSIDNGGNVLMEAR
jgi:N-methylhydantoinase A